ncbi:hypothetical protein SESBI_21434 [Sesbania bispinosa]|nr:hypothetical protein SESBI_21434 [Sesbania bispinosa]
MALVSTTGYHSIDSLCGRRQNWRLKVKLVRKWNMAAVATPDDPYALQILFVDEEGGRIEGTIQKHLMLKFSRCLVEGHVYKVMNFGIIRSEGKLRASRHDYKIIFNSNTQVSPCQDASIPFLGLSFSKTSDIKKTKGSCDYLLDFMGMVTAVSEEIRVTKERVTRLVLLDLVDDMWLVIIQLAKANVYKGRVGIQNVMNATKIWWNPLISECIEFRNGVAFHEVESDMEISLISQRPRAVSLREEFIKQYPRKTVEQLLQVGEVRNFITMAMITEIVDEKLWWYTACLCLRAVNFDRGYPFCTHCKRIVFNMSPRFKLKVLESDGEDAAHFIMFDAECSLLLKKSCQELLDEQEDPSFDAYPEEIFKLAGRDVLFRIEVKEHPFNSFDDSIKVRWVCFDSSILDEFKECVDDDTP